MKVNQIKNYLNRVWLNICSQKWEKNNLMKTYLIGITHTFKHFGFSFHLSKDKIILITDKLEEIFVQDFWVLRELTIYLLKDNLKILKQKNSLIG